MVPAARSTAGAPRARCGGGRLPCPGSLQGCTAALHSLNLQGSSRPLDTGRSFNGRTRGSGPRYRGSNPCLPAKTSPSKTSTYSADNGQIGHPPRPHVIWRAANSLKLLMLFVLAVVPVDSRRPGETRMRHAGAGRPRVYGVPPAPPLCRRPRSTQSWTGRWSVARRYRWRVGSAEPEAGPLDSTHRRSRPQVARQRHPGSRQHCSN
jgi:hypothetical protein